MAAGLALGMVTLGGGGGGVAETLRLETRLHRLIVGGRAEPDAKPSPSASRLADGDFINTSVGAATYFFGKE
jgi:hypothetical protein